MTPAPKLAVCIVDDEAEMRASFKALLKTSGIPATSCASAEDFLATYQDKSIGCLVLDVRMPGMGGLELLDILRQRRAFIPVIMLTGHADVKLTVEAMRKGALDVLEKPFREEELFALIRQGFARFEKLRRFQAEQSTVGPRLALLTPRELEVLDQMVAGKKSRKIADELRISTKTLDIHRSNIMRKMQTKSIADLVRWRLMEKADPFAINPFA